MGFDLYLDPQRPGPFVGLPTKSAVFLNPWSVIPQDWSPWRQIIGYDRELPTFAFTDRKPTGATDRVEVAYDIPFQSGLSYAQGGAATPVCIGFLKIDIARTLYWSQLIGDRLNPYNVEMLKWQYEWKSQSTYATALYGILDASTNGILPGTAYVWRPGVGLVGFLWCSAAAANNKVYGVWEPSTQSTSWRYVKSNGYGFFYAYSGNSCVHTSMLANVTIQSGDVLCVEYWAGCNGTGYDQSGAPNHLKGIMSIGGGTDYTADYGDTGVAKSESTATYNTTIPFPNETTGTLPISIPTAAGGSLSSLIDVSPRAGKGLTLTFDSAVGVVGPTIGAPVDGIGVPSVTATDSTHIDVDIDVPPTHPIGEATEDTPPAPPTGGGAFLL